MSAIRYRREQRGMATLSEKSNIMACCRWAYVLDFVENGYDRYDMKSDFLFFLPSYSPQLNIAETLWRILKGKWIRPQDYITSDMLFYTTNRALADIGKG